MSHNYRKRDWEKSKDVATGELKKEMQIESLHIWRHAAAHAAIKLDNGEILSLEHQRDLAIGLHSSINVIDSIFEDVKGLKRDLNDLREEMNAADVKSAKVKTLLGELEANKSRPDQKRIRRKLRSLGHKGGLGKTKG
jgi:hypothetical protein